MARTLQELQKQYHTESTPGKAPRGGPGNRGPRLTGKPKNTKQTVSRLLGYVGVYKWRLVAVFACMLITTVTSLIASYMLAPIINKLTLATIPNAQINPSALEKLADRAITAVLGTDNADAWVYVLAALAILLGIYLLGVGSAYLQAKLMMTVSQGSIAKLRSDLFSKLQTLPVRFFDRNTTGEVMSRFTNDIDNIDIMLNNALTSTVSGLISLIGTFIFMLTTNWILTLVTLFFIPLFALGGGAIAKASSKYYSGQQSALGAVNGYIEEYVTGQKVVKVFNHEETCVEEFDSLNDDLRDKQFKAQFFGGIMGPIMGNTSQISYGITIGIGGILMCTAGFTPGGLTVFAGYSKQFSMPINQISQQMSTVFAALAGAERVFAVMDSQPEQSEEEREAIIEKPMIGDVKLENVTFGYNPDKIVLQDISLYAHPGQKIAFVGSTGAGKTTVTNLITRFYDIQEGTITIDGVDIRTMPRSYLRSNIAMVLQDTHLFSGTVMENIRYGRLDATDEEVVEAAKLASAHSFIMRLENGYQTVLTGDGANLSQGQRQLLNIARAAISKAPILILDEATSSVDTRTERHIERGMARLMKNRTTFVIAHRLSTVRNANAIMVLEQGRIIERGDHDELLAMKGRYYDLYTGAIELD
ncbi:MAG: ABC transporter ATP-binding protein [Clostridia bacterium]|nr:ABC transporter ATP-binding protein [Clostridia bacterium]